MTFYVGVEEGGVGLHCPVGEAVRVRIGIGVEESLRPTTGPEPAAADLVGVGLAGDVVRQVRHAAGMLRGPSPREAGHRQVEATPEEVHRAALADEAGAEGREDPVRLHQHTPEAIGVFEACSRGHSPHWAPKLT